ncbi:glycosyltransferase family 4 protein [Microbacterium immunditiarum]|uniref:D-inositol 3-phosphate glycosyltransferase n=1 Tax=Microbacterium immunditiarum TaxID=337480 RepID=A0A7Y9GLK7_9MICO|nr:glycosyltransferase family 4 protein [Microbacterium immunditiarum]NYE18724.1 glycogen(starch) synthase [Microbacterium immunditiarum]
MAEIALVTSSFLPRVGGVEEHVRHVAEQLRDRGVEVAIWTADRGDDVPPEHDGIPLRVLPTPMPARSVRAVLSFLWRAPRAALRWRRALRADRPAVVHVHCFGPNGAWATEVARFARLPLVITSHGETFGDADDVFGGSALMRWALRRGIRRAAAVTAVSSFTARDLEERFGLEPGHAAIVMNGVDLDEESADAPPLPARYFIALGRLVRTKGFDLLVRAFASADLPEDVHLVIGGDGPERDALLALAAERGVGDRVHLPGRIGRGSVGPTVAGSLALVAPSRTEAFGIVVLEGWRGGVPVIATSHAGPEEIIRDDVDGWLADPFDERALAAALERAVRDPDASRRIAAAGRARVEEFGWDRVADGYLAVYAELAADDGSPAARIRSTVRGARAATQG